LGSGRAAWQHGAVGRADDGVHSERADCMEHDAGI
jgi:hypothetical protein